jgi:hypothetical protein
MAAQSQAALQKNSSEIASLLASFCWLTIVILLA